MGKRLKRIKKIRIHREGTNTLVVAILCILLLDGLLFWTFDTNIPFYIFASITALMYMGVVNFFRCPIRIFGGDTERTVVAPADGKIVVVEKVEENEYFHEQRLMISIFMNIVNVHANWTPVDGTVKLVQHQNGNFHQAWLPKASIENERSTIVIETPEGQEVMVRQIAGAVARRIVTYAREGEECYIDEHLGFIKFGSRVDVYLPLDAEPCIKLGQRTTGNDTVIAKLK